MNNKWKYEIDLSGFWGKDWDNSNAHEIGKLVAGRIRALINKYEVFLSDWELEEIMHYLEGSVCTIEEAEILNQDNAEYCDAHNQQDEYWEIIPIEEFDGLMAGLYDWADTNRVWIKKNK
jgi:hypothetical protein